MLRVTLLLSLSLAVRCETGSPAPQNRDQDGLPSSAGDCDHDEAGIRPGAAELCDGKDNDCDGLIDEGFSRRGWYQDLDGDGWGTWGTAAELCVPLTGRYDGLALATGDCDDTNATAYPRMHTTFAVTPSTTTATDSTALA